MNRIPLFLIFTIAVASHVFAQEQPRHPPSKSQERPYFLPSIPGWGEERFPIPIGFAPTIPLKGVEDIRFSPGWAKIQSQQYWTYAFLWYLEGSPVLTEDSLAKYLKVYYDGLYQANTQGDSTRINELVTVGAKVNKVMTLSGDLATFNGEVLMNDYLQRKPITLRLKVHVKRCSSVNTALFFELSPRPFLDENWKVLDQLWLNFSCN